MIAAALPVTARERRAHGQPPQPDPDARQPIRLDEPTSLCLTLTCRFR
jgi:hypothetical protein